LRKILETSYIDEAVEILEVQAAVTEAKKTTIETIATVTIP